MGKDIGRSSSGNDSGAKDRDTQLVQKEASKEAAPDEPSSQTLPSTELQHAVEAAVTVPPPASQAVEDGHALPSAAVLSRRHGVAVPNETSTVAVASASKTTSSKTSSTAAVSQSKATPSARHASSSSSNSSSSQSDGESSMGARSPPA